MGRATRSYEYARYIGDKWIGLAVETSKGWTVYTNVHGIIRRETGKGRHTIWHVQWFSREALPQLYKVDVAKLIYACFPHEYDIKVEADYTRIKY